MFCEQCGRELDAAAKFCSGCGRPTGAAVGAPASGGRVTRNTRLLGILWLVYGVFHIFGAVWLLVVSRIFLPLILSHIPAGSEYISIERLVSAVVFFASGYTAFIAIGGLVCAWGLLRRERWARVLSLIVGVVVLLNIPFGTALGIYTLLVFVPAESEKEYLQLSAGA